MTPSLEREEARTLLQEERARLQQIRVALEHGDGPSSPGAVIELQDVHERTPDADLSLVRLEGGEFGTCETCGRAIDADRLRARPAARFCVEHAHSAETPA
jgi:hypothetical protein